MALHFSPDMPIKPHNSLCCKDRIDDNDVKLFKMRLTAIALTRGDRGCIIRTDEQTVENDGFSQNRIVDTVGAGDCFTAVLTVGLLRNEPLDAIAEQANRLAAYVCSQEGAMPEMP